MTKVYRQRPSDILQLEGSLIKFQVDRGIRLFGTYVENSVDKAGDAAGGSTKNAKSKKALTTTARTRTLAKLLGEDMSKSTAGYRSV
jgi:hypothetical protein